MVGRGLGIHGRRGSGQLLQESLGMEREGDACGLELVRKRADLIKGAEPESGFRTKRRGSRERSDVPTGLRRSPSSAPAPEALVQWAVPNSTLISQGVLRSPSPTPGTHFTPNSPET